MAERNEKIYERVREELAKNADLGSRDLYEIAKQAEGSIGDDTLQQFHARYVLPLKREQSGRTGRGPRKKGRRTKSETGGATPKAATSAGGSGGKSRGKAAPVSGRDHARSVLLRFAHDFAAAETKTEIVAVMSRLDEYVDELSRNGS